MLTYKAAYKFLDEGVHTGPKKSIQANVPPRDAASPTALAQFSIRPLFSRSAPIIPSVLRHRSDGTRAFSVAPAASPLPDEREEQRPAAGEQQRRILPTDADVPGNQTVPPVARPHTSDGGVVIWPATSARAWLRPSLHGAGTCPRRSRALQRRSGDGYGDAEAREAPAKTCAGHER